MYNYQPYLHSHVHAHLSSGEPQRTFVCLFPNIWLYHYISVNNPSVFVLGLGSAVYVLILALVSRAAVATPVRATRSLQSDHAHCTTSARDLLTTLKRVLDKVSKTKQSIK